MGKIVGQEERKLGGDISVTALYTSYAWRWGGLDCAELLATPEARVVFRVTNFVLGLVRLVRCGRRPGGAFGAPGGSLVPGLRDRRRSAHVSGGTGTAAALGTRGRARGVDAGKRIRLRLSARTRATATRPVGTHARTD